MHTSVSDVAYLKSAADFCSPCGAGLGADIYSDGFVNITNVDISSVVISQMTSMYAKYEEMEFSTMDAKHMEFIPNCCFDVIVDKALFDSMLCGDENTADVQQLVTEMWRILKPGGVYLLVSHGAPPSRLPHLSANSSNYQWSIQHHELRKFFRFMFAVFSFIDCSLLLTARPQLLNGQALSPEVGAGGPHHLYVCKRV